MTKVWLVTLLDRGHEVTLEIVAPTKEHARREAHELHPGCHIIFITRAVWDRA